MVELGVADGDGHIGRVPGGVVEALHVDTVAHGSVCHVVCEPIID